MRRKEKRALTVIAIVAFLGVGTVFGIPLLSNALTEAMLADLGQKYDRVFEMGADVELDAGKDGDSQAKTPLFNRDVSYSVGLPFTGSMTVRVDDATLYQDPGQAGISESDDRLFNGNLFTEEPYTSEDFQLLLCKVTLKNIDAEPEDNVMTRTGRKAFPFNGILFPDRNAQPVYFDGTWENPKDGEEGYFNLEPGEQKTVTVGYAVPKAELGSGNIFLCAGTQNTSKYRLQLDIVDMRGESS